ncbi:MAG: hypothetical protein JWM91_1454 [Rhodospirillales bacterium]|nr:hypothetical protein [Rhodospirillales bacterium]
MPYQSWPYLWMVGPVLVGLTGLIVLTAGIDALARRRVFSAMGGIFGGGAVLALAVAILLLGLDVQTYHRLSFERSIATIDLRQTGDKAFDATVAEATAEQAPRTFALTGDEWRIEARVLKWKPWANVLGLDARYRLERLAGEFTDQGEEQTGPRSIHDLRSPNPTGTAAADQLWRLSSRLNETHLIDTLYGSATVMPMADGARYELSMTQTGLLARPVNEAATKAVGRWH